MDRQFEDWLKELDEYVQNKTGFCLDDLPDMDYFEFYEDERSFEDILKIIMEENGDFDDFDEEDEEDEDY